MYFVGETEKKEKQESSEETKDEKEPKDENEEKKEEKSEEKKEENEDKSEDKEGEFNQLGVWNWKWRNRSIGFFSWLSCYICSRTARHKESCLMLHLLSLNSE